MSLRAFHLDKYPFLPHFLFKTHFGLKFRLIRTWIFPKGAKALGVLEVLERTDMLHGKSSRKEKERRLIIKHQA